MPSLFCRGSMDCRRSRLGRRIDRFRRDSGSFSQARERGAAAAGGSSEEDGLAFHQVLRRSCGELRPVELLLECVEDIVVDRALGA